MSARPVGRPREFDEEVVLEAAMEAFWRRGYEATSMADLCEATGLHKGSLYQTFGDKHALFMQALSHYGEKEFQQTMAVAFNSDSPLENIRAVVGKIASDAGNEKGCLMTNSMVELAPHDPAVKALLQQAGTKRLRAMTELIGRAQQAGEIDSRWPAEKLARQLMVTLAGTATMVKGFLKREDMIEVLDDVIACWT